MYAATTTAAAAVVGTSRRVLTGLASPRSLLLPSALSNAWSALCVQIGGAENHRIGLYDMLLIKDNHIAAAGGVAAAVKGAEVRACARPGGAGGDRAGGARGQGGRGPLPAVCRGHRTGNDHCAAPRVARAQRTFSNQGPAYLVSLPSAPPCSAPAHNSVAETTRRDSTPACPALTGVPCRPAGACWAKPQQQAW